MRKQIELGAKYGRLVAHSPAARNKWKKPRTFCVCECGGTIITENSAILGGRTKSCGCLRTEVVTKHQANLCKKADKSGAKGRSRTREYACWRGIRERCEKNPNYAGRGISICERWENSFDNFIKDVGKSPGKGYELDRIDNNGNYEPGNCRWVTKKENQRNKRNNRMINYKGELITLSECAERTGILFDTLRQRLNSGWSDEDTYSKPVLSRSSR